MQKVDLHIHSTASDGAMSPAQVVHEAERLNLAGISITDHDTTAAYREAEIAAKDREINLISGAEITSTFAGRESHLLAYGFSLHHPAICSLLKSNKMARYKRARWIIGQLQKKGLDLDIDEVYAEANGLNIGRPHIASILQKKGYVSSHRSAFMRYLSDDALGPIQNNYQPYTKVIQTFKDAGGVMVLAHPGRLYSIEECKKFVEAGIDGIEVRHPSHTYATEKRMEKFADTHLLLTTAGSDFHGSKKDYYHHFGTLGISETKAAKLIKLANQRQRISV